MVRRVEIWLVCFGYYDIKKLPPGVSITHRILINRSKKVQET